MTRTSGTGMLFLSLALAGCRQAPLEWTEQQTKAVAPNARTKHIEAREQQVDERATLPTTDPQLLRLPLSDRLALEAEARPESAVRPEQLERALGGRGVRFSRKRQVLASTIGAAYCELAVSSEGLGLSVCEFADAGALARGSELSHRLFDGRIAGRTLTGHDGTLLTITEPQDARAKEQAALIVAVFNQQSPTPLETKTALAR